MYHVLHSCSTASLLTKCINMATSCWTKDSIGKSAKCWIPVNKLHTKQFLLVNCPNPVPQKKVVSLIATKNELNLLCCLFFQQKNIQTGCFIEHCSIPTSLKMALKVISMKNRQLSCRCDCCSWIRECWCTRKYQPISFCIYKPSRGSWFCQESGAQKWWRCFWKMFLLQPTNQKCRV